MTDHLLAVVFAAIVQMESGGRLDARNGDAVGPAQIKPAVVKDLIQWGHAVEFRDRETLEGSFRIFRLYTDRWVNYRRIKDTPEARANIWRHGPSSHYVLKGLSSKYSLKAESLLKDHNLVGADPNNPKRRRPRKVAGSKVVKGVDAPQGGLGG